MFLSWVIKHNINDKSITDLLEILNFANEKNKSIKGVNIHPKVKITKQFIICSDCDTVKDDDGFCQVCQQNTTNGHFLLLNIAEQISDFLANPTNFSNVSYFSKNLQTLGYCDSSKIVEVHKKHSCCCTLTINTDGMRVFRKSLADAWPIFLTINELPVLERYAIQNIFIPGIWLGQSKLSNYVVLNKCCSEIGSLESGINLINGQLMKVYCIYGSFDKPARAAMLNHKASNAIDGCCFCDEKSLRQNRKCFYQVKNSYQLSTHEAALMNMIKAVEQNQPSMGYKGFSPLRYSMINIRNT